LIGIQDGLRRFGCISLVLLIGCMLFLDVFHGIRLGQDRVAFHPIYRFRQSLAVAISRLHDPSPGGYLAYRSVVNVLNENGFAVFAGEPGSHLDLDGWEALLTDGPRLDRIIEQAKNVPIDNSLAPEMIQGNELGLADYIYFSFRLFGDKISSLYYFIYLVVIASCLVYALQFRNSPFLLFLLVVFLAELYFLENYAHSYGVLFLGTISNSRLYSGLSLLPAMHVLLVLWQRAPLRAFTGAGVVVQGLIYAFLLSCRTESAWPRHLARSAAWPLRHQCGFASRIRRQSCVGQWRRGGLRSGHPRPRGPSRRKFADHPQNRQWRTDNRPPR
jgi:hypothetical protein